MRFGARGLIALTAFLAGLALAVVPTLGANTDVTVGGGTNTFSPKTVTISQGDSVTWTNAGGFHNVKFDDGTVVHELSSSAWTASRAFASAGTFSYFCEAHQAEGMTGTVVVNAAGSTTIPPPGGGGPPGTGPPPTVHDTSAPKLDLSIRSTQRILRHRALIVSVRVDEQSTVTAKARITVSGASRVLKLRTVKRRLDAGERKKLNLRLSRKTRAAVTSALSRRSRLKAKLTVSAKDAAGNTRTRKRSLTVKK
jgi:plastocyanin